MLYDTRWDAKVTPAETLEPWRQVLLDAANLVETRGLAKGIQLEVDGSVCLMGAISIARFGEPFKQWHDEVVCMAVKKVGQHLRSTGVRPSMATDNGSAGWNNHPDRSKDEVVAELRAAAKY